MTDPGWVRWADVWRAERAAIGEPGVDEEGPRHAALCLSGGGIRSAACCLGVLQALAQARLLGRFHYASTVSGGGYIGAWLQILIGRFGVAGMQRRLADPGMLEVKHLRSYTNWLMPAGWLSMQGWTTVAIYLRNVLLNWLMFGPLFLLFALVCVGARSLFFALEPADAAGAGPVLVGLLFLALGFSGLVWGMAQACTALPSRILDAAGRPHYWDAAMIRWRILAPSMAWAFCAPLALAPAWPWLSHGWGAWALPGLFVAGSLAGYGVAATARDGAAPSFSQNVLPWCLGSLAGGLVVHAAIRIAAALPLKHLAEAVAVGGPPFLLLGYATVSAVHAGLRGATQERGRPALGGHMAALDVEWMARITAARLRVAVMWFVLSLSVLSGADAIMRDHPLTGMQPAWLGALLAGPAVAWLGKQAFSQFDALISGKTGLVTWDLLLRAGAVLFAAAVLIGSAMALQNWLAAVQGWLSPGACGFVWCQAPAMLASGGVLLLILTAADRWIQTNRFSMHGFYRERLVTAFAGSARPTRESGEAGRRRPDPLTGFDPDDNPALHSLSGAEPRRLFPVINATLNLTSVRRPDWADRKAAPFTFTPLHCGAASLRRGGRYVATDVYSTTGTTPVSLGTAMTVSGAAVSPNWGYHSSVLTAFVMTLFNARLGAWLPNPARWPLPANAMGAPGWRLLSDELFARAGDGGSYVYLSDGGHFDNLGIYEMLRRRCRLIVAVDATCDPKGTRDDLGALVLKARVDGLAEIEIAAGDAATPGLLLGVVRYFAGGVGRLIVLKPVLSGELPVDVMSYKAAHEAFPNESTADQWFTEAQFESYRAVAWRQATSALRSRPGVLRRLRGMGG